jgi:hypothetical protein
MMVGPLTQPHPAPLHAEAADARQAREWRA